MAQASNSEAAGAASRQRLRGSVQAAILASILAAAPDDSSTAVVAPAVEEA